MLYGPTSSYLTHEWVNYSTQSTSIDLCMGLRLKNTPQKICIRLTPGCVLVRFSASQCYSYPSFLLRWCSGKLADAPVLANGAHRICVNPANPWWRHQMETFSALLAICAGNSPVHGEFPAQRPVTRSFDVFLDLRLNKLLSKHSRGWWFETLLWPFWRHSNAYGIHDYTKKCEPSPNDSISEHTLNVLEVISLINDYIHVSIPISIIDVHIERGIMHVFWMKLV